MTDRSLTRFGPVLAASLAALALALLALFSILAPGVQRAYEALYESGNWYDELPYLGLNVATVLVGAVIGAKRPRNPIGWLLCLIGLSFAAYPVIVVVAASALAGRGDAPLAVYLVAWVGNWVWVLGLAGMLFTLLLFPSGSLLSRRLRPVAFVAATLVVALVVVTATSRGPLEAAPRLENPFALPMPEPAFDVLTFGLLPLVALACGLLIARFWRSKDEERQQMKWVALGGAIFASSALLNLALTLPRWTLFGLPWGAMIAAIAIAVLRYRLYDIDVVINRTLVYGSLTATLVLVYFGGVVSIQGLFQAFTGRAEQSQLAVVVSTLGIAALFNPLRRRIQAFIDRLFYRRKYDATRTLEAFSHRLRDETDLETLNNTLVSAVRETIQPAHVSLWLRPREEEP
jgi:MFS family permease